MRDQRACVETSAGVLNSIFLIGTPVLHRNHYENRGLRGRFSRTAQQRQDESCYAAYLQDTGIAIFSENFSSIHSVLSYPFEWNKKKKKKKMKQKHASTYES